MKTKNSFVKKLNILDGIITWDGFDIDETISLEKQEALLREDMMQIGFGKRFVVDVGWQPDFDPKGNFVVQAIQDYDWMHPLSKVKCHTLVELKKVIEKAVFLIDKMRKIKDLPDRNPFKGEKLD